MNSYNSFQPCTVSKGARFSSFLMANQKVFNRIYIVFPVLAVEPPTLMISSDIFS